VPLAMSRTVVKTDVCDSSRGPRSRQMHLDRGLKQVLDETLAAAAQFESKSWHCRFDGDSSTWVIPPEVPKAWIAAELIRNLDMALRRHNRHTSTDDRLRLRVALDHGEVEQEGQHVGGRAITTAARLCDSEVLRAAMREAPGVHLGLIVSESFYRDVIVEGELDLDAAKFTEVDVEVKSFRGKAWIYLVNGLTRPPSAGSAPSAPGPGPKPDARSVKTSQHSKGKNAKNIVTNHIQY
jgi:hypothetical protein